MCFVVPLTNATMQGYLAPANARIKQLKLQHGDRIYAETIGELVEASPSTPSASKSSHMVGMSLADKGAASRGHVDADSLPTHVCVLRRGYSILGGSAAYRPPLHRPRLRPCHFLCSRNSGKLCTTNSRVGDKESQHSGQTSKPLLSTTSSSSLLRRVHCRSQHSMRRWEHNKINNTGNMDLDSSVQHSRAARALGDRSSTVQAKLPLYPLDR